ncbi:TPA: hypothetical protein ACGXM6_004851 [Bacillus cereus]
MHNLMTNLKYFLIKILSYSFFLRFTDDTNFGTITKNSQEFRISLISFNVGQWIFYIITIKKDNGRWKFNCFKILKLKDIQDLPDLIVIDRKYNNYESSLTSQNYDIHREALQYKISQLEDQKNKSFNKYLAYIAIIALIIPLYSSYLIKLYNLNEIYLTVFSIALLYSFINLLLFIYSFIKIKATPRKKFSFIRQSSDATKAQTLTLYYDWLVLNDESTEQVTIIKNIEKYMIAIISISIVFVGIINAVEYKEKSSGKKTIIEKSIDNNSEIFHFDISGGSEFLYNNKESFSKIESRLLKNKDLKIIIIYNKNNINANYQRILNLINTYSHQDADIIKIENAKISEVQVLILKGENR